ncbi:MULTISPECIES: restriction endonuclease subunit S [Lactococcus]|uniref:restriction endonuclease subunit S n=1 Tax=Lactococcus TaxID=1357 RepID=UPI000305FDDB|nr:restriction endonuclease subunit S [Lactococcus lactis]
MAKIDDSVKKKVPELRFPGFTDDWEERKLGEVYNFQYGQFNNNPDNGGQYPIYGANGIIGGYDEYNSENAIVIGHMGAYAGHVLWAEGKHFVTYNGTMGIADKSILNSNFGYYLVVSVNVPKLTAGSGQPFVSYSDLNGIKILIPTIEEQQKIGSFFKQLDNTIALHQRKLDLLKEQKKGYLQKMFPKNGAKVPELRFAGFADDWEERKSKDIFKPKIRKGEPDLPVLSVTQTSGVVYRDEVGIDIKYDISTLKNYKVIEPNDFVISLRSFQGGFELSDKLGITSPAYTIFVPKSPEEQNNLFWRIQFKRFQFIQSLKTVTFGIRDGKSISFNEFGDLKIKFPSNILEQQKIGAFFKKLDDTIALHQRKLDLLKEQKKGFLQKMFV